MNRLYICLDFVAIESGKTPAVAAYVVAVCVLTKADRMGRNTVRVAGLLANSVTADTSKHASRVTAHGGKPLIGSS